jgi:hypothetical protein
MHSKVLPVMSYIYYVYATVMFYTYYVYATVVPQSALRVVRSAVLCAAATAAELAPNLSAVTCLVLQNCCCYRNNVLVSAGLCCPCNCVRSLWLMLPDQY